MIPAPIERDIDFTTLLQYTNETVALAFQRTQRILMEHSKPIVSVSGGSDSDVILDMIWRLDSDRKARYIWIDTGLEMQATKDHIADLQTKYGIEIETIKPKVPIPLAVKKYGVPFLTKDISDKIHTLQVEKFNFTEKGQISAIRAAKWWNNEMGGMFQINTKPWLKEFMISTPPQFRISDKCCMCAKKRPAAEINTMGDLSIVGIRTAEGGVRSAKYKSCFYQSDKGDKHFPAFWYLDGDKRAYNEYFGVVNSAAYTVYGFRRTGCAGCPFNSKFDDELATLRKYEPKLAVAAENIFGESYEYARKYNEIYSGRPAIIVSCDKVNDTGGTVEVVYLTTAPKCEMVTHVTIRSARKMSTALCEQISTVSVDRLGDCYGVITESEMKQIDHALAFSLGLPSAEHRPETPQVGVPPTKYLKMETERDLYKQMYLELLERSIK